MWCQNQIFGDPHGCLVATYKPFGTKNNSLAWKKSLEPFRARFENTMGHPFFDFVKYRSEHCKKKFIWVIMYYFMRKMLSEPILDLRKCPNWKTHESESAGFLVGALHKVWNQIWKQFSHKVLYNYYSNFFWALRSICNKVKKWISHYFFKSCAKGFKCFFSSWEATFCAKRLVFTYKTAVWVPLVWILSSPLIVILYPRGLW